MKLLGEILVTLLLAGFFAFVILEWMAGCGETYVDAQGKTHQHECIFFGKSNNTEG